MLAIRAEIGALFIAAWIGGLAAPAIAQPASAPTPRPSPKADQPAAAAPIPRLSPKIEAQRPPAAPTPRLSPKREDAPPLAGPAQNDPARATAAAETATEALGGEEAESAAETTVDENPAPATATPEAAATPEVAAGPEAAGPEAAGPEAADPGAASAASPAGPRDWRGEAAAALRARLALRPIEGRARNVILMIGDGLGVAAATAIRLHQGQAAGGLGDDAATPQELFPHSALAKTYTANAQSGDGAATATAMMSGVKTRSGVLGLDDEAVRGRCGTGRPLTRIGDLFAADGRAVGYVTTARITHATPAAGYGVSVERLWEHDGRMPVDCLQRDLAQQLIGRMTAGEVDLAFGGGRAAFFPVSVTDQEQEPGARRDGRNLLAEARADGVRTVWNDTSLAALDLAAPGPILGLFASGSMAYDHDRLSAGEDEPSLAQMTAAAITALEAASEGEGYFLMVEGGRIGQASHFGNLHRTVTDGAAFSEAVARAAAATDPSETLIIVAGDASHSLAFNGYCGRGSPVPGLCFEIDPEGGRHGPAPARDAVGAPFETAGFLNGPGAGNAGPRPVDAAPRGARPPELTAAAAADPDRRQRALVPMETVATSAADAPVYARGPWAHLIDGVVEQHYLFHVMRYAAFGEIENP